MNLALAYDSETTGLPLFQEPSSDPRQPHLVQLAAVLVDLDTRERLQTLDVIIRPNGWEIPDEVAAIHGITTERAMDVGVLERTAVELFYDLWGGRPLIAHNESFDRRIIRIGLKRYLSDGEADMWKDAVSECTAKLSASILNLPPTEKMIAAGRHHPKTPKLSEAFEYFMGRPLDGAHSALVDVNGCLDVYWAIKDRAAVSC